ncbi:hypothetical protein [Streptomyces sp. NPDC058595]
MLDGFDALDVIAHDEVLYAGGTPSGSPVTVELISAQGPEK